MIDLDKMIEEKLVPIRKRAVDSLANKHPYIFSVLNGYLSRKNNYVGLQVTENGKVIGEYTFYLDGLYISKVVKGTLSSEIHHPFGIIKPYGILEKSLLEKMVEEEERLVKEPFSTMTKYMPDITIKFLQ